MAEKLQHERFLGRRDVSLYSVRILMRRAGLVGLGIVLIFSVLGSWSAYQKKQESAEMRAKAEHEYQDLVGREVKLRDDVARLSTARGKESVLRERYGLGKEGEYEVIIVESTSVAPVATTTGWKSWVHTIFR